MTCSGAATAGTTVTPTSRLKHKREAEREARERDEERRQQEAIEARIAEMNRNSAPPEAAYGAHTVHTEDGPFVWATLTQCWRCEFPMLLWNAQSARSGVQHMSAPSPEVRREVGPKRYENHRTSTRCSIDRCKTPGPTWRKPEFRLAAAR